MTDGRAMRFARCAWGVAVASLWLASPATGAAPRLPDLLVTDLTNPPPAAVAGGSFAMTATVKNVGSEVAAKSTTEFWLVTEDGETRLPLTGVQDLPQLLAGASSAAGAMVIVPPGTPGGLYFIEACADAPAEIPEGKEGNNCRRSREEVSVEPRPSLVVTALTDPPAAAPPGSSFTVTTTVKNLGSLPASGSTTKYYLVAGPSTLIELDATEVVPPLAAGAAFTDTETLVVPLGTPLGPYRLQACADATAAVAEDNEGDNCRMAAGAVNVLTQSDLVLTTVALTRPQVNVMPGGTLAISAVARNNGVLDAGDSTITFALVPTGGGATVALVEAQVVPSLPPGSSASTQTSVTVPADTAIGTYRAMACIDAAGVVAEGSDSNNCTTADGIVSVQTVVVSKPDLVVTVLGNPPATAIPGQSFVVTATVENQGVADAGASSTSFSLVPANAGTRKNLKGMYSVDTLAPGTSATAPVTVTLYSDTVPNTYVLRACADGPGIIPESGEGNNCRTSAGLLQVLAPPDLTVTAVANPPATAAQGQAILATSTIKNVSTVPAAESTARYYLVAIDGSRKIDLSGKPPIPAIEPGHTFTATHRVKVRAETVPGPYFLQACADSGKVLAEKNENNNCFTAAGTITVTPRPDLVTESVLLRDPAPVVVLLGGTVRLEFTVTNQGPGPAAASQMRFFLVNPNTQQTKDLKGHPAVPKLDKTKSATVKSSVTVFTDSKPGTYRIRGCADYNEAVPETDETNNCVMATGTIRVQ
jgi:subtilase family serine protease